MNDEQVKRQVDQMVAFIKQEANDKAIELRTRGDEEYNTRVLTTVEAAKETIRAEYDRKAREISLNQKRCVKYLTIVLGGRTFVLF
jgi:V-type H+-transporting ATPase subunit E